MSPVAERRIPAQGAPAPSDPAVEDLAALLAGAMSGVGHRGPSSDPRVLARRLLESERVHVDAPGRLSSEQVVDLALRCGRAETAVASLEAALGSQVAEASAALAEAEVVRERLLVASRDLALALEDRGRIEDEAYGRARRMAAALGVAS